MEREAQTNGAEADTAATPALSARALVKRFGATTALDGVSLEVAEGECVALVGESGSGKTTLLRCFNALVRPDSGRVLVDSGDVSTVDVIGLRRSIGYVPQDGGLLPHWNVGRNVELVLRLQGATTGVVERGDRALRLVGRDPDVFRERCPSELPGDQRHRI